MGPTTFQMTLRMGNVFSMQGRMEQWTATETGGITPGRMDSVAGGVMSWDMMQRAMRGTVRSVQSVIWGGVNGECTTGRTRVK